MFQESAPRVLNVHRSLTLALSLSAAAGWSSFAIVRHTSAAVEHQIRDQVTSLQATQTQLVAEQTKTRVSLSEMAQLQGDLAAARREINLLSQVRDQIPADLPPVRPKQSQQSCWRSSLAIRRLRQSVFRHRAPKSRLRGPAAKD
jgi:hypothetical protein